MRSIRVEYSFPGFGTSETCRLRVLERTDAAKREMDVQWVGVNLLHQDTMSRVVDGLGHWEVVLMKDLQTLSEVPKSRLLIDVPS